jgi:threonine dehydratase
MVPEVDGVAIREAEALLRPVARRTPLLAAHWLEQVSGKAVFLKCENLQRSGSFKIRGAFVRMSRLTGPERRAGVVAASAGNHAQGVALAAADLGISATVFMPRTASLPKLAATRANGADVRLVGETVDEALAAAQEFVEETGAVLIHPFDHVDIVAGQGSVGLEIVEQLPEVASILVPAGGGGLLAGVAAAVKSMRPATRIFGVQAEGSATLPESFRQHRPVPLDRAPRTMADGIAVGRPGAVPVAVADGLVDDVVTVSEEQIADGVLQALERAKLLVEPAGVVGVSAFLADPQRFPGPVAIVLSGGNVDPLLLNRIIEHGLALAGRYVAITVRMPDRPGTLAGLLGAIAETDVNVVDINHLRADPRLEVGEVEIVVLLETRGRAHRDRVLRHLHAAGYAITSA